MSNLKYSIYGWTFLEECFAIPYANLGRTSILTTSNVWMMYRDCFIDFMWNFILYLDIQRKDSLRQFITTLKGIYGEIVLRQGLLPNPLEILLVPLVAVTMYPLQQCSATNKGFILPWVANKTVFCHDVGPLQSSNPAVEVSYMWKRKPYVFDIQQIYIH